ncbi:MAG: PAS domain S-box protein, partial [Lentisphaerae bacterium]|nr:PAS domain S-box protein [Lentisphaerota bacterium]
MNVNIDINKKTAAKALRASELRYRRLFESARDGILILDAQTGRVVDVNPFLIQLLGITREYFLNHYIWELGFFKDIAANEAKFAELQTKDYVRYEDLPLEAADGRKIEVEFVSNVYLVDDQRVIQCNIRDITERKRTERMAQDALTTLNRPNNTMNIIRDLLKIIRERTGVEAVGIRLRAGEDFPYYLSIGFPDAFVELENQLCVRDAAGRILKDSQGRPVLECMCGNVIRGRLDSALPIFTTSGSFWCNCTT